MAQYSLVPSTKPNGEKVDIPEVWLRYTNGNHYDALLKSSHPLITQGSLKERGVQEEQSEQKQTHENKCDKCQFTFTSKENLEEHKQETGHSEEFWEIFPENERSKVKPLSDSQDTNGENVTALVKELLEFDLTSESKLGETNSELVKERKEPLNHYKMNLRHAKRS